VAISVSSAQIALNTAKGGITGVTNAAIDLAKKSGNLINIKEAKLFIKLSELKKGKGFECSMLMDVFEEKNVRWDFQLDIDIAGARKFKENLFQNILNEAKKLLPI